MLPFAVAVQAADDPKDEVRLLTESIKNQMSDRNLPYYMNASGEPIRLTTFDTKYRDQTVDIPPGAACIIVFTCPVGEDFCGVEYHGINGIIRAVDADRLESQFMTFESGSLPCTRHGSAFFEVRGVASTDTLNMRATNKPRSKKIGKIPHNATCITNHGCVEGWCRVEYDYRIGWVNGRYLTEYITRADNQCVSDKDKLIQGE